MTGWLAATKQFQISNSWRVANLGPYKQEINPWLSVASGAYACSIAKSRSTSKRIYIISEGNPFSNRSLGKLGFLWPF